MEIKEQSKLRFKGVDFPFLEVKSSMLFKENEDSEIKVDIVPRYFIPEESNKIFLIVMSVSIDIDRYLKIDLQAIGKFELSTVDEETDVRDQFINANAPAIMFPYVRSFISTLTSNLGKITTQITLPTRFFKGSMERIENIEEINGIGDGEG